jgi:hypothetical protein
MDILSHGLFGAAPFYKKAKSAFWIAFFFGLFPDLIAFGWNALRVFSTSSHFIKTMEPPPSELFPQYIHTIYNFSHSLIIFTAVFLIVWAIRKKPFYEMLAWAIHILMDIPTHTAAFFPTPFLFPLSSYYFGGISWGTPWFFFSYWAVLFFIYGVLWARYKEPRKKVWFKAKNYGWGWTPCTWQGWLILLTFIGLTLGDFYRIDQDAHSASETLISFGPHMLFLIGLLILICYRTGEKPEWRWGGKKIG